MQNANFIFIRLQENHGFAVLKFNPAYMSSINNRIRFVFILGEIIIYFTLYKMVDNMI